MTGKFTHIISHNSGDINHLKGAYISNAYGSFTAPHVGSSLQPWLAGWLAGCIDYQLLRLH